MRKTHRNPRGRCVTLARVVDRRFETTTDASVISKLMIVRRRMRGGLGRSTRSEPRRSLVDPGYLGMWPIKISRTWCERYTGAICYPPQIGTSDYPYYECRTGSVISWQLISIMRKPSGLRKFGTTVTATEPLYSICAGRCCQSASDDCRLRRAFLKRLLWAA